MKKAFLLVENIPVGEKPTYIEINQNQHRISIVILVGNSNGYSIDLISLNGEEHHTIKLKQQSC